MDSRKCQTSTATPPEAGGLPCLASIDGNNFTSPPPGPIFETAKAVNGHAGVLFIY